MVLCKEIMQVFHIFLTSNRVTILVDASDILTRTESKKNAFTNKKR